LKKKDVLWAVKERDPEPDIVTALVNINNSVVALARAVTKSNGHLWMIIKYIHRTAAWCGMRSQMSWMRSLQGGIWGMTRWSMSWTKM